MKYLILLLLTCFAAVAQPVLRNPYTTNSTGPNSVVMTNGNSQITTNGNLVVPVNIDSSGGVGLNLNDGAYTALSNQGTNLYSVGVMEAKGFTATDGIFSGNGYGVTNVRATNINAAGLPNTTGIGMVVVTSAGILATNPIPSGSGGSVPNGLVTNNSDYRITVTGGGATTTIASNSVTSAAYLGAGTNALLASANNQPYNGGVLTNLSWVTTQNSNTWLNVLDFGAVPNTTNGNWVAFEAARDAAGKTHRMLVIPAGRYGLTNEWKWTNSNVYIQGLAESGDPQDSGGVILHFVSGSSGLIFTNANGANSPNSIRVSGISIQGKYDSTTNNIGLKIFGANGLGSIDRLDVRNTIVNGFKTNVWAQEVSNSHIEIDASFATANGMGYWSSGFCNGNVLELLITGNDGSVTNGSSMTGMNIHERGSTVILRDMGGPGMGTCIELNGSYATFLGGNIEWYGGTRGAIRTVSAGNNVTFSGTQVLKYASDDNGASFAFGSDGAGNSYYGDIFITPSVSLFCATNIGGSIVQVIQEQVSTANRFYSERPRNMAIYNVGTLLTSNAVVQPVPVYWGAVGDASLSAGQVYYDANLGKYIYCLQTNKHQNGFVQVDLMQYYRDVQNGTVPATIPNAAYTNVAQNFTAKPTFKNGATGSGIFIVQTNTAGSGGVDSYGGAIAFRGYNDTFDFGQFIWFYPTGSSWMTVFELAPNGNSADHTPQRGLFGVWGDGTTRVKNLIATNGTFAGTFTGNGGGLTNVSAAALTGTVPTANLNDFSTNLFSGFLFPMATNNVSTITTATNIFFTGLDFSSTLNGRWGEVIIRPTANIVVTNPAAWFSTDGLGSRTILTNQVLTITVEAIPGFLTNASFTILQQPL